MGIFIAINIYFRFLIIGLARTIFFVP